jgi:hypothetical protein
VELFEEALFGYLEFGTLCLMWTIWKERNSHTFENKELSRDDLAKIFLCTLFDWARGWGFTHSVSLQDFIHSLMTSPSFM